MVLVREEVLRRGEYLAAVAQRMRTGAGMRLSERHHDPQREKDKKTISWYIFAILQCYL